MYRDKYGNVKKSIVFEGKRYYVRGKTEKEALRKLGALEAELKAGNRVLNSKTTVQRWSEEWIDVYIRPRDITKKSAAMYQQKLDNYILPAIGIMRLEDVRDTHLQRLLNQCDSSWSTAQKVKIVLQAMFRQARRSRLILYDPAEGLSLPKAKKGVRRSITDTERRFILDVAETHYAGLYVLTILYCGVRPNEAAALQWKDVYWDAEKKTHMLRIDTALESGNSNTIKRPKTTAGIRNVPIPDELWKKMAPCIAEPFDYIFQQPRGKKRHTESSLNDFWNNFKRSLDIHMGAKLYRNQIIQHCWEVHWELESQENWESLVPYCLRHTYGTDLQRAGVPINVAKYLLGHSDISVTGNIYTDTTPDVVYSAGDALNLFYASLAKKKTPDSLKDAV